jgi:aminoglycoside phosphotransferase family enzyme
MDLTHLIEALAQPAAYPGGVDRVEVHHTHISVVFLVGQATGPLPS